jgi:hypothetical protein
MTHSKFGLLIVAAIALGATQVVNGQGIVKSADARAFIGTWVFAMINPQGAQETVRIVDENGILSATVQSGRFPPIQVTGLLKDGDMLVLTATRFENGRPIRAVISLIPQGQSMNMAQMLEFSETIKRGSGRKQ